MDVQWYPGHMTKARRMMEENIRLVDLVIELVDARIPLSSSNPDIDALCAGKGRIVLLCKADLADPEKTEAFLKYFREKGILASAVDAREKKAKDAVQRYVQEACREKLAHDRARGIVGRPLRAMVAGIPNVGKSTFINSFAGRASTKTGNKPGVTRGKQWIRLGGGVELLDTPGILWPKFDDPETGMRLALVGAVRDEILDKEELAVWLLDYLREEYPGAAEAKYLSGKDLSKDAGPCAVEENLPCPALLKPLRGCPCAVAEKEEEASETALSGSASPEASGSERISDTAPSGDRFTDSMLPGTVSPSVFLLEEIAVARRLLMKGGAPDTARAAAMVLDDCKNGRIGRISLDRPRDARMLDERRAAARKADGGKPGGNRKKSTKNSTNTRKRGRKQ